MNFTQSFFIENHKTMNNIGTIRIAAAVPRVYTADTKANTKEISTLAELAASKGASLIVFPELCVTGYSCADLFSQKLLQNSAQEAVKKIAESSLGKDITLIIGTPVKTDKGIISCSAVLRDGRILGLVPKDKIQESISVTYAGEKVEISSDHIFRIGNGNVTLGIHTEDCLPSAQIITCPTASYETIGKHRARKKEVICRSLEGRCGYIYVSAGYGESTQDLVYSGAALVASGGKLLADGDRFAMESTLTFADIDLAELGAVSKPCGSGGSELCSGINAHPFIPADADMDEECGIALSIQTMGLVRRLEHIGSKTAVIGISGGLDSTLALLVTALAADKLGWPRENIIGVTMPGYGTSDRTYNNALEMMRKLGITVREISIAAACDQHFKDIGHDKEVHDTTYENSQARERTQILMDVANQCGGIVIGTGDLSELALGWATYNGDHMSMYGVNASIPKTLVRHLVKWAAENKFADIKDVLIDVVETPVSPELLPADDDGNIRQVTEDLVGPYELHDFFLYDFCIYGYSPSEILRRAETAFAGVYDRETIKKWLRKFIWRFFSQQFKRSCLPDGPKVTEVSLSPRGGWSMPSDAICRLWIDDIE